MPEKPKPTPEMLLLASILIDPSILGDVAAVVSPVHIADRKLRAIYSEALEMAGDGKHVDIYTLAHETGENILIADLYELTATAASWKYWADRTLEEARRRQLLRALHNATEQVQEGVSDPDTVVSDILAATVQHSAGLPRTATIEDAVKAAYAASEEARKSGDIPGLPTGFRKLDDMLGGIRPGRLMTVAAETGKGKSSLAVNLALSALKKDDGRVVIFSMEMAAEELAHRMAAQVCSVSSHLISTGQLTPEQWTRYLDACNELSSYGDRLMIRSGSASSIIIRQEVARLAALGKLPSFIVVDHLQLAAPKEKGDGVYTRMSRLTSALKDVAVDYNIGVIALSQFSRKVEGGRPRLWHLRDSGSIEQDSDIVLFIWHRDENDVRLIVEKNRGGPTGEIAVRWIPHLTKFADVMPGEDVRR